MSVGGQIYLACDGEELLGDTYPMPADTGSLEGACDMTSEGRDIGLHATVTDALDAEISSADEKGWLLLYRMDASYNLCASCAKIWLNERSARNKKARR